jgi:hypothetical protein
VASTGSGIGRRPILAEEPLGIAIASTGPFGEAYIIGGYLNDCGELSRLLLARWLVG